MSAHAARVVLLALPSCGEEATALAERGWRVVPLHTPAGSGCTCRRADCHQQGKHPRIKGWQQRATTDPARIRDGIQSTTTISKAIAELEAGGRFTVQRRARHANVYRVSRVLPQLYIASEPQPLVLTFQDLEATGSER